mgnify:FL=1
MKSLATLFTSLGLAFFTQAQAAESRIGPEMLPPFSNAPTLLENFSCYFGPFASYDSWLAGFQDRPNFDVEGFRQRFPQHVIEQRQSSIDCRVFVYESDGLLVEGVMLRPRSDAAENRRLPVVVYNRGGNPRSGLLVYGHIHSKMMPLAELGYIVIASQYRGGRAWSNSVSAVAELDQFGGDDVHDVKNLMPIINGMPDADSGRIAMYGASRGGMMSYLAARDMPQLKALIVEAGVADLEASLTQRPEMENVFVKLIPNYATEKSRQLRARSVLHWLDELPGGLPILLLHGDQDARAEVEQSLLLAKALAARDQPHRLVVYPGADHGLQPHRAAADAEIAAWLERHL